MNGTLKSAKNIVLHNLRGNSVMLKSSIFFSVKAEQEASLVTTLDGNCIRVKESPEEIAAAIAASCRAVARTAGAYAGMTAVEAAGEDPFADPEELRRYRIMALREMAFSPARNYTGRLGRIYAKILNPFAFFSSAGMRSSAGFPSNYRIELEERMDLIMTSGEKTEKCK